MNAWPDARVQNLFKIELPIVLAPMAGPGTSALAIAVAEAGGLGSLPCAMLDADQIRGEMNIIRQRTARPINLNFFCHPAPTADEQRERAWRQRLDRYYLEMAINSEAPASSGRRPFDSAACVVVEEIRPEVVSFHFGLPEKELLDRARNAGAKIISSATTVMEACWLAERGCDAIIAQGYEAGGHRGMFLGDDISTQIGTMALVPRIVDAVNVPVIASGGIADARGIVAAFALGAAAVQIGTAYLFCPEAKLTPPHRRTLQIGKEDETVLTNVFSGRPARGIVNRLIREVGPMSDLAPQFPLAGSAIAPLRAKAESLGSTDFTPIWSGQAAALCRELPAGELTRRLATEAMATFRSLGNRD